MLQCKDRDEPDTYVSVVRFSLTKRQWDTNHPDTAAMAARIADLCDGPTQFRNLDLITQMI